MDKFLYLSDREFCSGEKDGLVTKAGSGYVKKYNDAVIQSIAHDNWKNSGASAQYQHREPVNTVVEAAVTGICRYSDTEYLYTVQVNDVSAILKKDYLTQAEQYVLHSNKQLFKGADFNNGGTILTAVSDDRQTSHIASFNIERGDLNVLTSGDSVDENPSFSHKDGSILFNSRGVGRNQYLQKVSEGNSTLFRISAGFFSSTDEIMCEENIDLVSPKEDKNGNLYYIRKPHKLKKASDFSVLDIILMPFRLIYNLFRLLFFLSNVGRKSKKKTDEQSSGNNPYMTPTQSERDLYIMNEKINIEKEEKANTKKGDKHPGFAPRSFELYKQSPDGAKTKLKSGVLDYDITPDGTIVFTNGRYIIRLDGESETVLTKDRLINRVKIR